MNNASKNTGNSQYIAELDEIANEDEHSLFPDDGPDHEMRSDQRNFKKPPADLQGARVPDSISGSQEQLLIRTGEDLLHAEQVRRNRPPRVGDGNEF